MPVLAAVSVLGTVHAETHPGDNAEKQQTSLHVTDQTLGLRYGADSGVGGTAIGLEVGSEELGDHLTWGAPDHLRHGRLPDRAAVRAVLSQAETVEDSQEVSGGDAHAPATQHRAAIG